MGSLTDSRPKKIVLGVLAILAGIEIFLYFASTRNKQITQKSADSKQTVAAQSNPKTKSTIQTTSADKNQSTGLRSDDAPSHLADLLNSPTTDIKADLRLLDDIFQQYRSAMHGDDPIGDNKDITAALTGKNKLDFAFIPKNNPAINSKGELCDRWGSPFFFHQLSGTEMQIRSAGPDKKLFTDDDIVITPGLYPPHL
jgi:hypothetical protein